MLGLVTSWMKRMADDVLLRNVLHKLCSATQGTLAVNDQFCHVSASFHLLVIWSASRALFSFLQIH